MLVEFGVHLKSRDLLTYDDSELCILQKAVLILKKVTIKYSLDDDKKDVGSLLESFSVGTDRSKRIKLTGNPSTMIPFCTQKNQIG
jgi:hypothetical protein